MTVVIQNQIAELKANDLVHIAEAIKQARLLED